MISKIAILAAVLRLTNFNKLFVSMANIAVTTCPGSFVILERLHTIETKIRI